MNDRNEPAPLLTTITKATKLLAVSDAVVKHLIETGELPVVDVGGRQRLRIADVERLAAGRAQEVQAEAVSAAEKLRNDAERRAEPLSAAAVDERERYARAIEALAADLARLASEIRGVVDGWRSGAPVPAADEQSWRRRLDEMVDEVARNLGSAALAAARLDEAERRAGRARRNIRSAEHVVEDWSGSADDE